MQVCYAVATDDQQWESLNQTTTVSSDSVTIDYEPYAPGVGQQLKISSGTFMFVVNAVPAYEDSVSGYNRWAPSCTAHASSCPFLL